MPIPLTKMSRISLEQFKKLDVEELAQYMEEHTNANVAKGTCDGQLNRTTFLLLREVDI